MKLEIAAPLPTEPEPILQRIEVATARGIPAFHIIGLPAPEVAEARERVRAAMEASGLDFPRRRVLINLSPANIRKRGTGLDLGMALAVIQATQKSEDPGPTIAAWGELGLDGGVKPVGYALRVYASAWKAGVRALVCARDDYPALQRAKALLEKARVSSHLPPTLLPSSHLRDAIRLCKAFAHGRNPEQSSQGDDTRELSGSTLSAAYPGSIQAKEEAALLPLSPALERVVTISASGSHHLLILGPRGVGKSHALEWRSRLEPEIHPQAILERHMLAELLDPTHLGALSLQPPIRRVGSQVRPQALFGRVTSSALRPGECSLAHGGILLADELPEWHRDAREALREPLESRKVTLTRVNGSVELPAAFTLIANGNLCPCGGWPKDKVSPPAGTVLQRPSTQHRSGAGSLSSRWICECRPGSRSAYIDRLSGPILDRIDLICQLMPETVFPAVLPGIESRARDRLQLLREQVIQTRKRLTERWGTAPGALAAEEVERIMEAHSKAFVPLAKVKGPNLRFRHKIARIALTLAEWDGMPDGLPRSEHYTEAACYRVLPSC